MAHDRKSDEEYGLKIEKPSRKRRLSESMTMRILLLFLVASVLLLMAQQAIYHKAAGRYETAVSAVQVSVENSVSVRVSLQEAWDAPVNINTADVQELCRLNGIGESKAQAIVDYRTNNGLFTYKEELTKVSGIGEKLYASIAEQIVLDESEITTE